MQIRSITWPEGQPVGVTIDLSGQIYKLVTSGSESDPFPLMRWETRCATCGEVFYATSSITKLMKLNRRCPLHVDPTVPVPVGTFDEFGAPLERRKRVAPRNLSITSAEAEWSGLRVGDSLAKPGVKTDSVRRSCARWEKALPGREFVVVVLGGVAHAKRVA